jgi:outer membrane lipoprotein-sorting protein
MEIGWATGPYVTIAIMRPQSVAAAVLLLGLAAAASMAGLAAGQAPDLFDELYARGQKQNGNLRTFTAAFTETTSSSLLTRPLVASGTVAAERPGRVALRYTVPDERLVLIDDRRMTITWPARGVKESRDIGASQRRVQKSFVDGSPSELRSHFQITATAASGGGYRIAMIPTRKQIKEGLSRLDLTIDGTTLLMSGMKMTFPNGDTKEMTFTGVKVNPALDQGLFSPK